VPEGETGGIIPLMAVHQPQKSKVRPVMDYRELNRFVQSHTADSSVCEDTLRLWRQRGDQIRLLDLKDAYLQLRVDPELWRFQQVIHRGKRYYMTRLGFGLSSAPRIMTAIMRKVLCLNEKLSAGTNHYIDDVMVDTDIISVEEVTRHLAAYGLLVKPPEKIEDSRVLGLRLSRIPSGKLWWQRDNDIEADLSRELTRRELFSICGKLIGHFPIGNWLRCACSYVKRLSCSDEVGLKGKCSWENRIGPQAQAVISEILERVREDDPVGGIWSPGAVIAWQNVRIWCDASSMATGIVLDVDDTIIEDASWLRSKTDHEHINVAELDSVIKGVNLALKWQVKRATVMTDSATVFSWLSSVLEGTHRIKTKGISEMLVRRRLDIISKLIGEYQLQLRVELVPSAKNLADSLTRVPSRWLRMRKETSVTLASATAAHEVDTMSQSNMEWLRRSHRQHHLGADRTKEVAERQTGKHVTSEMCRCVVRECSECNSIDPTSIRWRRGHLSVSENWLRLSVDITHVDGTLWLSVVDSGPSRFAVWRHLKTESAVAVSKALDDIFCERGPPVELLMDNGAAFRSAEMRQLLDRWGVKAIFRAAHRPSGNGIVERNFRTVKRTAARCRISIPHALFWYNATKKDVAGASPAELLGGARWRLPPIPGGLPSFDRNTRVSHETSRLSQDSSSEESETDTEMQSPGDSDGEIAEHSEDSEGENRRTNAEIAVGDEVFTRPPTARCHTPWPRGVVTGINSERSVDVNGVPRHVADVRLAPGFGNSYRRRLRRTGVNPTAYEK